MKVKWAKLVRVPWDLSHDPGGHVKVIDPRETQRACEQHDSLHHVCVRDHISKHVDS